MHFSSRRWGRSTRTRWAAAAATVAALSGVLAGSAGHADIQPISDVGVTIQSAQATLSSAGQTTITYQNTATVTPNRGALLRMQYYNDGTVRQLSATVTVDTGSKLDPGFTLSDPACSPQFGTTDKVVCRYSNIDPGQAEPFVYIAITIGTTAVTSTVTQNSVVDSVVPVPQAAPDGDDSGQATTNVGGQQFSVLTDGESATFNSGDGKVTTVYSLPPGATGGGAVFVNQREDTAVQTCGTTSCYPTVAVVDFQQVGGTNNPPAASNPFTIAVTYNNIKQVCNGLGGPSGCNPIFYQHSGSSALPVQVPLCSTYSPNSGTPFASSDPCVYKLGKNNGVVTYFLALLRDINLPISNPAGV